MEEMKSEFFSLSIVFFSFYRFFEYLVYARNCVAPLFRPGPLFCGLGSRMNVENTLSPPRAIPLAPTLWGSAALWLPCVNSFAWGRRHICGLGALRNVALIPRGRPLLRPRCGISWPCGRAEWVSRSLCEFVLFRIFLFHLARQIFRGPPRYGAGSPE